MFLQVDIEEWAEEKGIYEDANLEAQLKGIAEEVVEVAMAETLNDKEKELGDIYIWWINACKVADINPHTAVRVAFEKVTKRTGTMVNGRFVKDDE